MKFLIIVIVLSAVVGSVFGLLARDVPPPTQIYGFSAAAVYSSKAIGCPGISGNYSDWFEIKVIGNRTNFNYQSITIYSSGTNLQFTTPLNDSFYSYVQTTNSTLQTIIVPLPLTVSQTQYLDATFTYFISGYAPQTQSFTEVPLRQGSVSC